LIIMISIFVIMVMLTSALAIRSLNDTKIEDGEHIIVRAAIFTGLEDSYYFTLDKNRNLISYRGIRQNFDPIEEFEPDGYLVDVSRKRRVRISDEDFQYIMERVERLQKLDHEFGPTMALGGVNFALWHGGEQYHTIGLSFEPTELVEIRDRILKLSPLLDKMHSFGSENSNWLEEFIKERQRERRMTIPSSVYGFPSEPVELDEEFLELLNSQNAPTDSP